MDKAFADYLLGLDKYIVLLGATQETYSLTLNQPVNIRWKLQSLTDPDQIFLVDIKESEKKALKISMHHQDENSQNGLLRIDYHSRHRNPEEVKETVPAEFIPYAGIYLDEYPAHIHYVIDGYAPLAWAIPLEIDPFPIKDVTNVGDIAQAITNFCLLMNVKTNLAFSPQLRVI